MRTQVGDLSGDTIGMKESESKDHSFANDLADVVLRLRHSREETHNIRTGGRIRRMPSRAVLSSAIEQIASALFPTHYGDIDMTEDGADAFVENVLNQSLRALGHQLRLELQLDPGTTPRQAAVQAGDTVQAFAGQLPEIRGLLVSDLQAAYEGDPAAKSYPEILLSYPGMLAIIYHRLAHALLRLGVPLSARLISSSAHAKTAIDIHPGAEIGPGFFIDHGTGVVIGETTIIGERVKLYQAVTLGARSFPKDQNGAALKGTPRHPILEDDVVVYAGATILGRIVIGQGSVVGGNVWLTQSVPPGSHISQAHLRNE